MSQAITVDHALSMTSSPSLIAFVIGAAALGFWVDLRFPSLAPNSLTRRMLAAGFAFVLLEVVPVVGSSTAATYASLFGALLPAFVAVFLTAFWLLRAAAAR